MTVSTTPVSASNDTAPAAPAHDEGAPISAPRVEPASPSRLARLGTSAARGCVLVGIGALSVLFLSLIDAQWLKLDDFYMVEHIRSRPMGEVLGDIVTTRTTPHVRFAFIHHLILLPVFRWWFESRTAVNALYLLTLAMVLGGGVLLCRPLARRAGVWSGAWLLFSSLMVSTYVWSTMEFKTAGYLLFCFGTCAGLVALSWQRAASERPLTWRDHARWSLLAISCIHFAEIGLLVVFPLGFSLALQRRLDWRWLGATTAWPFCYWLLNKLLFPRPLNLLEHSTGPGLLAAVSFAVRTFQEYWISELVLAVGLLVWVVALSVWRAEPGGRVRRFLITLSAGGAFLAAALGLIVLAGLSYMWAGERHLAFAGLGLTACSLWCAGALTQLLQRAWPRAVLAVLLAGFGVWKLDQRLPRLLSYVEARRAELTDVFSLQREVRAMGSQLAREGQSRDVVVFVPRWIIESRMGDWVDPSFMSAGWAAKSFAKEFSCPEAVACPRVTYVTNLSSLRTHHELKAQQELCRMLPEARVMVARTSFLGDARDITPLAPGATEAQCLEWLVSQRLVDAAAR
ncbi:hypothetical protein [Archangium lipolyticum]|uniref:hypothetical protein n=1 Tax=Archangium lipolyticum TaxID=2970465 RepID=UPI002149DB41|nr:hypothetical protein [Archangium lipolyticum]